MDKVYIFQWMISGQSIRGYGMCENDKSVCVIVANYKPVVYIQVNDVKTMQTVKEQIAKKDGTFIVDTPHACNIYGSTGKGCFFAVAYNTFTILKMIQSEAQSFGYVVHEANVSKTLQFLSRSGLPSVGWINVPKSCVKPVDKHLTVCDREYIVFDWQKHLTVCNEDLIAPKPIIIYFDLEVNSETVNTFPCDHDNDVIFQIGMVTCKGSNTMDVTLLSLIGNDYSSNSSEYNVVQYDTEEKLILGFINYINQYKANVLCGYNIMGFDIPYIIKRCTRYSILGMFKRMGCDPGRLAVEKTVNWMSSAYRCQKYTFILWEGLLTLDLLPIVAHDHKLDAYKLENVAQHFLKCGKDPIKPKDIFKAYRTKHMAVVGKYCIQDTTLCRDLANHLNTWLALCEMARVCNTDIMPLFTQGQQIKVYSQIYKECTPAKISDKVYVVSSKSSLSVDEMDDNVSYTGAFVYEPKPGVYSNVIPMDFSSLYPSIIISKNICYSTFVDTFCTAEPVPEGVTVYAWQEHNGCEHDQVYMEYKQLRGVLGQLQARQSTLNSNKTLNKVALLSVAEQIRTVKAQLKDTKQSSAKNKCSNFSFGFYNSDTRLGVLPRVLKNLLQSRANVRSQMKLLDADDPIRAVLDKRQLAYKISANSVYGSMGTTKGYLPFMQGAMTTTYCGRKLIERAAELLKTVANAKLVYGDTDSCYVNLGHSKSSFEELWNLAVQASKTVSSFFDDPVRLEFEQTIYVKFIIFSKKRYIYRQRHISGKESIGSKGVLLSRRDNAMCARDVYRTLMEHVLTNNTYAGEDLISEAILKVMRPGALHEEESFVITKSIGDIGEDDDTGTYKVRNLEKARAAAADKEGDAVALLRRELVKQLPAQAQLAERLRLQGRAVDKGSRVEYVVLQSPKGILEDSLAHRILDLDSWKENKYIYPLDRLYYVKSMITACDQIFAVIGAKPVTANLYQLHKQFCQVMAELKIKRPLYKK
ncbi:DNA polymerase family B [European chub iridovirus]|nr:DNA polymerase family B [European chub iridovirus]